MYGDKYGIIWKSYTVYEACVFKRIPTLYYYSRTMYGTIARVYRIIKCGINKQLCRLRVKTKKKNMWTVRVSKH